MVPGLVTVTEYTALYPAVFEIALVYASGVTFAVAVAAGAVANELATVVTFTRIAAAPVTAGL
jgi:hypothetical protein